MRKVLYSIITVLSIVLLSLIISIIININNKKQMEKVALEEVIYTDTRSLPERYTKDLAKSRGDVVIAKEQIYNRERLDKFINNIEKNKPDKVQIVAYTRNGDALIEQLYFDGNVLTLITDNTRDKGMLSEHREVNTYEAVNIVKQIKTEGVVYIANLSNGERFDIAYFKANE